MTNLSKKKNALIWRNLEGKLMRKGFTIIEVVAVFLLILGVTFLILPKSLETTKQAKFISQWTEKYSELEYMFSVIKAQKDSEIKQKLSDAQDNEDRSQIVLNAIEPYLRVTTEINNSDYKQFYMDRTPVSKTDKYYFPKFFNSSSGEVIGVKWLREDCKASEVCAIMSFDVNGEDKPNTWGYDVFGVNVLESSIEPIGKGVDIDTLKNDCSRRGYGVYCSNFYLIGGRFD